MREQDRESRRKRMERLAWLLDSAIPIPGTGLRIGLDGFVGLFPGLGDTLGALASSIILAEAARLGAPKSVVLKMAFNVALDTLLGAVPVVGDIFDLAWKANRRNVALLEDYLRRPARTVAVSRLFVTLLILALLAFVAFVGMLALLLLRWLWLAVQNAP